MKIANVCFLIKDDNVLLAMKKRGFGVGKWNGVGGKVKEGETVEKATVREAKEEIGVEIMPSDLEKIAEIYFNFPDKEGWDNFVHCYVARKWKGEPSESEEMKPEWFKISEIPYDQMWIDDKYWLNEALAGEKIKAEFYFVGAGEAVGEYKMEKVKGF